MVFRFLRNLRVFHPPDTYLDIGPLQSALLEMEKRQPSKTPYPKAVTWKEQHVFQNRARARTVEQVSQVRQHDHPTVAPDTYQLLRFTATSHIIQDIGHTADFSLDRVAQFAFDGDSQYDGVMGLAAKGFVDEHSNFEEAYRDALEHDAVREPLNERWPGLATVRKMAENGDGIGVGAALRYANLEAGLRIPTVVATYLHGLANEIALQDEIVWLSEGRVRERENVLGHLANARSLASSMGVDYEGFFERIEAAAPTDYRGGMDFTIPTTNGAVAQEIADIVTDLCPFSMDDELPVKIAHISGHLPDGRKWTVMHSRFSRVLGLGEEQHYLQVDVDPAAGDQFGVKIFMSGERGYDETPLIVGATYSNRLHRELKARNDDHISPGAANLTSHTLRSVLRSARRYTPSDLRGAGREYALLAAAGDFEPDPAK